MHLCHTTHATSKGKGGGGGSPTHLNKHYSCLLGKKIIGTQTKGQFLRRREWDAQTRGFLRCQFPCTQPQPPRIGLSLPGGCSHRKSRGALAAVLIGNHADQNQQQVFNGSHRKSRGGSWERRHVDDDDNEWWKSNAGWEGCPCKVAGPSRKRHARSGSLVALSSAHCAPFHNTCPKRQCEPRHQPWKVTVTASVQVSAQRPGSWSITGA
jgi:hypothetical protein